MRPSDVRTLRWGGQLDENLEDVCFRDRDTAIAAFKEMTELMQRTKIYLPISKRKKIQHPIMQEIGLDKDWKDHLQFKVTLATEVIEFTVATLTNCYGFSFPNLLCDSSAGGCNVSFMTISRLLVCAVQSAVSRPLKHLFLHSRKTEKTFSCKSLTLDWGAIDNVFCFVYFPSKASLRAAMKEMSYLMQHFVTDFPFSFATECWDSYLNKIFYNEKLQSIFLRIEDRYIDDERHHLYSTVYEKRDGSVFFSNVMTLYEDMNMEPGEYPPMGTIDYAAVVNCLYRFTFAGQKPDLSTFLMGVNKPASSVFRFFKHPLCERQVLRFVQQF